MNTEQMKRLEKNQSRWATFIVLFYFVVAILRICAKVTLGSYRHMSMIAVIIGVLIGCAIEVALLTLALGRKQITVLLYIIGLVQLVSFIRSFSAIGIDSLGGFSVAYMRVFKIYPLVAISDILSLVYTILLLVTAVRQTVLKRSRELAEQSDVLS